MTVGQLAAILQSYPQDMRVVVDGYEDGYDYLHPHLVSVREVRLDTGEAWWEGQHRESGDTRTEGSAIVSALVLHRPTKT